MEELIKKAKKGNKEAFTQLILNIETELYKIARLRLKEDFDIDEAIQETMIKAFKYIKKLKHEKYFKTWIIKILINNCNDIYRKKKYYEVPLNDYEYSINSNKNSIEETNNKIDFYNIICILGYEERLIVTLYYMENFNTKEISKLLKKNENTIKSKLFRAKNKLKKLYEGDEKIWMN